MKIKFLRDVVTKEANPQSFKKDQEVDFFEQYRNDDELKTLHGDKTDAVAAEMAQRSAQHWLNRGAAVQVVEEEGKKRGATDKPKPAIERMVPHDKP